MRHDEPIPSALRRTVLLVMGSLMIACGSMTCGRTEPKVPAAAADSRVSGPHAPDAVAPTGAAPAQRVRRLALLVGINDYKQDFDDLHGCLNDTENMFDVLTKTYGMKRSDIVWLRDKEATLHGIQRAFEEHLIANAREDTSVVFYYSGHGSQMYDVSGDETDGWDETLVTYDSGRGSHENRDLSDDVLNGLLTRLSARTKHVAVILDSCHSGTAVRAAGQPRAAPPDCRAAPDGKCPDASGAGGVENAGMQDPAVSYSLISGARTNEYSYERVIEGETHGAMTWYLTRALRSAAPTDTYRDVMDKVRSQVTAVFPTQHPQLEGAGQDEVVFGIERRTPAAFVDAWRAGNALMLAAGSVHGITKGSVFALYPEGTKDFAVGRELSRAKVSKVAGTSAVLQPDSAKLPERMRAVERSRVLGMRRLRVRFLGEPGGDALRKVREQLLSYAHIMEAADALQYDVLLHSTGTGANETLTLEGGSSRAIAPVVKRGSEATAVAQVLGWAKWYALAAIENDKSPLLPEFSYTIGLPGRPSGPRGSDELDTRVPAGESFEVSLHNRGARPLYLHLLDLSADGSVSVVYPPAGAAERIDQGVSWTTRIHSCIPARWQGSTRDILKLFVTTQPTDFRFLQQAPITRGARGKGDAGADRDPLSALLASSAIGERGFESDEGALTPDDWATYERAIEVLPADGAKPCQ